MRRNIIYEKQFMDELRKIEPDEDKADNFIRGIEWVLQQEPRSGTCIFTSDPPMWFIPTADVYGPAYVIYYTFNEKKVFMLSIREADQKFTESGGL